MGESAEPSDNDQTYPSRNGTTGNADVQNLYDRIDELEEERNGLKDKLIEVQSNNKKYRQKAKRLEHENEKLKQPPLFVATIKDTIENDGPSAIIRQHGNNQEAVTDIPEALHEELEPGTRVAVNNNLSIVETLTEETDARAQVMEIEESPDVTYADIGGLQNETVEVRETVELPITDPERFTEVGVNPPNGILLYGPPGTGKTMMAKAVANQTDATFLRLAGSELVQKFIGEGANLVRDMFEVAEEHEPAIVFIDELDAIASRRTDSKSTGDQEVQRTLMQLLNEMDGFEDRGDITIMGATNRHDMLDDAILRPGRFDRLIEIGPPDEEARAEIFQIHTRNMSISDDVDFEQLAQETDEATGADINAICTEAGMVAIREDRTEVTIEDFEEAHRKIEESKQNDPIPTTGYQ